MSIKIR